MALYSLQDATLNGHAGQGYVYHVSSYLGTEYRGVFFADDEDAVAELSDAGHVPFEGTVYRKTSQREDELTVDVKKTIAVRFGTRVDFEVV